MEKKTIEILLIEDDRGYAKLITEMTKSVKAVDIVVSHAQLLMEGISVLAEKKIDVVLLDLTLPDSEGIDTFLRRGSCHKRRKARRPGLSLQNGDAPPPADPVAALRRRAQARPGGPQTGA
jgi:CheY-like chemotaxis protein